VPGSLPAAPTGPGTAQEGEALRVHRSNALGRRARGPAWPPEVGDADPLPAGCCAGDLLEVLEFLEARPRAACAAARPPAAAPLSSCHGKHPSALLLCSACWEPTAQVFGREMGLSLPNPALVAAELLQPANGRDASIFTTAAASPVVQLHARLASLVRGRPGAASSPADAARPGVTAPRARRCSRRPARRWARPAGRPCCSTTWARRARPRPQPPRAPARPRRCSTGRWRRARGCARCSACATPRLTRRC